MANNHIAPGTRLDVVLTADILGGVGYLMTEIVGITGRTAKTGETIPVHITGIWQVNKVAGSAWTQGQKIYWDDTAKAFTHTVASNKLAGYAALAAASSDVTGQVRLLF